jgi:hypothetical protein
MDFLTELHRRLVALEGPQSAAEKDIVALITQALAEATREQARRSTSAYESEEWHYHFAHEIRYCTYASGLMSAVEIYRRQ